LLLAVFILSGVFCLYYHPFALYTIQMCRLLSIGAAGEDLLVQRKKAVDWFDKF